MLIRTGWEEPLAHRADDPARSARDVVPGEFVDAQTEILQFVSTLGVTSTFRRCGVAELARDLDDDPVVSVEEVDASDGSITVPKHDLRRGARQTRLAHQPEEVALEHRVTACVGDEFVDQPDAATPSAPNVEQAC